MTKQIAPYGFWESKLSVRHVARKSGNRSNLRFFDNRLYYCDTRPSEAGRTQIVSVKLTSEGQYDGDTQEHLPTEYSAASSVHEYGGAPYCVTPEGLYFSSARDQQVYFTAHGSKHAKQITNASQHRFADLQYDQKNDRLLAVAEYWTDKPMPENYLVSISLTENGILEQDQLVTVHTGHDFYSGPRISPDGEQLAFVCWDMPDMPWDKTVLYLSPNNNGNLQPEAKAIIDQPNQAVIQPTWSAQNELYFINDPDGWWQLQKWQNDTSEQVFTVEGEMGLPMWVFGQQSYAVIGENEIVFSYSDQGIWRIGHWSSTTGITPLVSDASGYDYFVSDTRSAQCYVQCAYPTKHGNIAVYNKQGESGKVFADPDLPDYAVSTAIPLTIPVVDNKGEQQQTHAFYYPPVNDNYQAPDDSLPPLIVIGHGGPTGQTTLSFNEQIQFWTSRGFAVADVNYRGSTGFGRAYRESLYGQWGIYDVADCVAVAEHLVAEGKVHPDQLIIRGKSAGGYSVLAALCFHDVFTIGGVHYGISDLTMLAEDTHKFEARYLDKLIAPYPSGKQIYIDRSPINHLQQMNNPVIVLQGLLDKVVPPSQAEAIVDALRAKSIDVKYVTFADEKHGFRQAENVEQAFTSELEFYLKHIK